MKKNIFIAVLFLFAGIFAVSQEDDFQGFDFGENGESKENNFTLTVGGDLHAGLTLFFSDFKKLKQYQPALPVWGSLHIEAKAPLTEAYFGITISDKTVPQINLGEKSEINCTPLIPRWIEQAYMQAVTGPVVFGGGIKKMTWGRADAMSVLDVLNPRDYTDLSELDEEKTKIPQPMFYLSFYADSARIPLEMKLHAVYLPVFEPHRFALKGKWQRGLPTDLGGENIPKEIMQELTTLMPGFGVDKIISEIKGKLQSSVKSDTLEYSQGGARYTLTIDGVHDLGFQYFYGRLLKPAVKFGTIIDKNTIKAAGIAAYKAVALELARLLSSTMSVDYDRYHHIGIDYGSAIGPVNIRTEFAANITEDIKGDNPYTYNPTIAYNIGFDYTMPFSISINAAASEVIVLNYGKIEKDIFSFDLEKKSKRTDTRLLFILSQKLIRGSLEWRIAATVGIEDADFMIAPGLHWQFGTLLLDADAGFFGGKKTGKLGKYRDNHFIKFGIGYAF